jgi:hypothetical protein
MLSATPDGALPNKLYLPSIAKSAGSLSAPNFKRADDARRATKPLTPPRFKRQAKGAIETH